VIQNPPHLPEAFPKIFLPAWLQSSLTEKPWQPRGLFGFLLWLQNLQLQAFCETDIRNVA
jgi:hypothetical protein